MKNDTGKSSNPIVSRFRALFAAGLLVVLTVLWIAFIWLTLPSIAENYLEVKIGMSRGEVAEMLGKPDETVHLEEVPPMPLIGGFPERDRCDFGTGEKRIRVVFVNEKVWKVYLLEFSNGPEEPRILDSR